MNNFFKYLFTLIILLSITTILLPQYTTNSLYSLTITISSGNVNVNFSSNGDYDTSTGILSNSTIQGPNISTTSDSLTGYYISITSTNNFKLQHPNPAISPIPYSIRFKPTPTLPVGSIANSVNSNGGTLVTVPAIANLEDQKINAQTIEILTNGSGYTIGAGEFTDTPSFTITAN